MKRCALWLLFAVVLVVVAYCWPSLFVPAVGVPFIPLVGQVTSTFARKVRELASDPSGNAYNVYLNTTTGKMRAKIAGVWADVGGGASGTYTRRVASVAGVEFGNFSSPQNLYTVPAGQTFIPTKVIIRNPSELLEGVNFSFGFSELANDWMSSSTEISTSADFALILPSNTGSKLGTAGQVFKFISYTGSSATATIDVFGYFL